MIVGAFAVFALVEKGIISSDIASSLVLLLVAWSIGHIYDSSYWYNRNLVIIANIERQFLTESDVQEIHFYFSDHRKDNRMISHLKIQMFLSVGLAALVMIYHFSTRVYPGIGSAVSNFEPGRALPYLVLIASLAFLVWVARGKNKRYKEFLERSPGKNVESGALGAIGHGQ